jgi:hypothetical protein
VANTASVAAIARPAGVVRSSPSVISGDTKADWSDAFALVPRLEVAYVWHASKLTREVLHGLLRIGFLHDGLGLVLFAPVGS